MSGISGEINFMQRADSETVLKMSDTLSHRGKHIRGIYKDLCSVLCQNKNCRFEHEKTSYMMEYRIDGKKFVIVHDGDIFNKQKLIDELKDLGYRFKTREDKEVILYSFIEWGEECVKKFNGAFAFALWESHNNKLFIARDPMGLKPFFYWFKDKQFLFASEIKGLLAHPNVKPVINSDSVSEIMILGPGKTPECGIFKDVFELLPGHFGYVSNTNFYIEKYWSLKDGAHEDSLDETAEKIKDLLIDSIINNLEFDTSIFTMLSGGLDSSIITAVASKELSYSGNKLNSFSVTYKHHDKHFKANDFQPASDNYYIDIMKNNLNIKHENIVLDNYDLVDALNSAVDARDLPAMADIDSSLLLFCRELKKHGNIGLSGECSDEIFGGYPWYQKEELRNIDGFPWCQSTDYRMSFLNDDLKNEINGHKYLKERYEKTVNEADILENTNPTDRRIKQLVNLNFEWFMKTLVDRNDRMSNYNGLEVRTPFCDLRIVEYLYKVPWEMKNYKNCEKGLLRYAMRDYLPQEVLWRKKSPYPKTHNPEYFKMVANILREIISDENAPILKILDKKAIEKLLGEENNPKPWYGQLMTTPQTIAYFIQINYWLEKYNVDIVQ